ncbi:MAG: short chain dehydrogenase [Pseudomonadales bacterium]
MNIVIVGATGTIGSAVVNILKDNHRVITVGHTQGEYQMDIALHSSIEATLQQIHGDIGSIDALVFAAGKVAFAPLAELSDDQWKLGINNKLMGQINLTTLSLPYLSERASITLTSGILGEQPIAMGVSAAAVNGAIDSFVRAAATELPPGVRINSVSATVVEESLYKYADFFPGFPAIPAARAAQAYKRSILGVTTGEVLRVFS